MTVLTRRAFLAASAAALAASATRGEGRAAPAALPAAPLGRTGRELPRLGFGGAPIGRLKSDEEAVAVVREALRLGVRYLDTAPSYGGGRSERRIGAAIRDSGVDRGDLFLATKTLERRGADARRELEASLDRLGVEYVDALQVHEVHDDVGTLFGPDSVLAALERARDEGLVRHIGITGHRNPRHLVEAVRRYEFATALVPVNPLDVKHLSFIRDFVPVAAERGVGVVAMKVFAGGRLLEGGRFTAAELLRYALSRERVPVAVPGCEAVAHVREAHEAVSRFEPLSADERAALEERAGAHRGKGSEWYKDEG